MGSNRRSRYLRSIRAHVESMLRQIYAEETRAARQRRQRQAEKHLHAFYCLPDPTHLREEASCVGCGKPREHENHLVGRTAEVEPDADLEKDDAEEVRQTTVVGEGVPF